MAHPSPTLSTQVVAFSALGVHLRTISHPGHLAHVLAVSSAMVLLQYLVLAHPTPVKDTMAPSHALATSRSPPV